MQFSLKYEHTSMRHSIDHDVQKEQSKNVCFDTKFEVKDLHSSAFPQQLMQFFPISILVQKKARGNDREWRITQKYEDEKESHTRHKYSPLPDIWCFISKSI